MDCEKLKPYKNQEGTKRTQVEKMFDNLAPEYDYVNHTMSLGIDRIWRQKAIDHLKAKRTWPLRILDVATGTADLAILAAQELGPEEVIGIDISDEMMNIGRKKIEEAGLKHTVTLQNEDCAALSFAGNYFEAVMSAFALRNFENLDDCLKEMHRVLTPGGNIVVIDLCAPTRFAMKQIFQIYKAVIMPLMGKKCAKDSETFRYLPESMEKIEQGTAMVSHFEKAGFKDVRFKRLSFSMCCMYTATK